MVMDLIRYAKDEGGREATEAAAGGGRRKEKESQEMEDKNVH